MHIEYAQEILEGKRNYGKKINRMQEKSDFIAIEEIIKMKEQKIIDLIKQIGDEKSKDIALTIESNLNNKYFHVTPKMTWCLTTDLLSKLTAEEIINIFK